MNFTTPLVDRAAGASAETIVNSQLKHHKLIEAAQQFEGMLLQELLKPMKSHACCPGQDADSEQDTSGGFGDTLNSYGLETLASAIARAGGMGIARRVVDQVEGQQSHGLEHSAPK